VRRGRVGAGAQRADHFAVSGRARQPGQFGVGEHDGRGTAAADSGGVDQAHDEQATAGLGGVDHGDRPARGHAEPLRAARVEGGLAVALRQASTVDVKGTQGRDRAGVDAVAGRAEVGDEPAAPVQQRQPLGHPPVHRRIGRVGAHRVHCGRRKPGAAARGEGDADVAGGAGVLVVERRLGGVAIDEGAGDEGHGEQARHETPQPQAGQ
jgi:hypothetical protein